ncbi:MAG: hypothetical protein ACRYG8_12630 [Janthinobacterium lividum]
MIAPPQGPLQPRQPFDSWCLAGLRINAEIERDRIRDAAWLQKQDPAPEPSPYLAATIRAWLETRASIEDRARRIALGIHSFDWGACLICMDCPEHHEELIEDLRREVGLYRAAIDRQITEIEERVFLLIAEHAPGEQIIATAETVRGPLPRRRIIEVCRRLAATSQRTPSRRRAYA